MAGHSKWKQIKHYKAAADAKRGAMKREGDQYIVTTDPASLHAVKQALEEKGVVAQESEITMLPKTSVHVEGKTAESLLKLMEELEELDDVQKVEANFDIDLAEMARA